MKLSCRFWWHNWSHWSETKAKTMFCASFGVRLEGSEHIVWTQSRKCLDCGKVQNQEVP